MTIKELYKHFKDVWKECENKNYIVSPNGVCVLSSDTICLYLNRYVTDYYPEVMFSPNSYANLKLVGDVLMINDNWAVKLI